MIKNFSLLTKINIIVACVFLFVTSAETLYTANRDKDMMLELAKEQTRDLTTWYFDSLNTMMLTGTMNQREILREKIIAREKILEARVIRGDPVKQQFGKGFKDEQIVDELDKKALSGESVLVVNSGLNGRELTVVTPFRASEKTRGVNCLRCHDVEPGSVNGAVRIKFSLADMDEQVARENLRSVLMNLVLFAVGMLLVNIFIHRWFKKPIQLLMEVVKLRAQGDTRARAMISGSDELGRLGNAFNKMAENVNAVTDKEHREAIVLQKKVDELCAVMKRVTEGDLNVEVGFGGEGAIGELATNLQVMIDFLKDTIDEKQASVEVLNTKVGRILKIANLVADGDLTVRSSIKGGDVIAQLANGVQGMISSLNSLVAQIQASGVEVASSTKELSACMADVQLTAEHQAETTADISVTATEISSTTAELLGTMSDVAKMAENATTSAEQSHAGLEKLQEMMEQVIASSENVSEKLEILDERARNINAVVITIAKVADQTNLLALNASLEAEKAGEYGRGFSIVAAEIRRLADQVALSTLDIEQMVSEMQSSVSSSVETMNGFTHLVRDSVSEVQMVSIEQGQIIQQVETMGPNFEALHQSMHFQAQGAEQIHLAMIQLNHKAENTVSSLNLSANLLHTLDDSADALHNSVSKFKVKDINDNKDE